MSPTQAMSLSFAMGLAAALLSLALVVERRRRRRAEADAALCAAIFDSLSTGIAALDRFGALIRTNRAWCSMPPAAAAAPCGPGGVLEGARTEFTKEYAVESAGRQQHLEVSVEALRRAEGGAVVSIRDITARKAAEADARRRVDEIAHLSRITTVAGLTASLAHELRQPLTAIRANASAGLRLLTAQAPDIETVREIMRDVADAVTHAASVIDGMRDLLRRGGARHAPLDVNEIVSAVARLVAADAAAHGTQLRLVLQTGLPPVLGDGTQVQQVLLNLVLNAIEAMDRAAGHPRRVTVTTAATASDSVTISVHDTGPGLPGVDVFEPFHTTKSTGVGMGLTIARLLVEAHGGRIWGENGVDRGAVFHVVLPATAGRGPLPRPPHAVVAGVDLPRAHRV